MERDASPSGPATRPLAVRIRRWIYFVSILILWYGTIGTAVVLRSKTILIVAGLMTPLAIPAIVMFGSWVTFGLRYSELGWNLRTPIPADAVPVEVGFWNPWCRYYRCSTGVGMYFPGLGGLFLPYRDIVCVEDGLLSCGLAHRSLEVRSPLEVPRAVGEIVLQELSR